MRLRAIGCALWYGVLPWQVYEGECHYAPMGYFAHLGMNARHAFRWLAFRETEEDRRFEAEVNAP